MGESGDFLQQLEDLPVGLFFRQGDFFVSHFDMSCVPFQLLQLQRQLVALILSELLTVLVGRIDLFELALQLFNLLGLLLLCFPPRFLELFLFVLQLLPQLLGGIHQVIDVGGLALDDLIALVQLAFELDQALLVLLLELLPHLLVGLQRALQDLDLLILGRNGGLLLIAFGLEGLQLRLDDAFQLVELLLKHLLLVLQVYNLGCLRIAVVLQLLVLLGDADDAMLGL